MRNQIIILFLLINQVKSHSWIGCTDYTINTKEDTYYWDRSKCSGYPRGFQNQYDAGFGVDTGFELRDPSRCQSNDRNSYSSQIPMAKYIPGQRVCISYPSKNHVADMCTNKFIPDEGVIIKRSINPKSDNFNNSKSYQHLNGVHVKGEIDYKGYQNCPKFCEDKDKSLCTMCFNLESDISSGIYTFKWVWEFNPKEFYYTCWDAKILGNQNNPPLPPTLAPLPPTPTVIPLPPCGPTVQPTPKPTEHEKECPGFPGTFVSSLIHCPSPTPKPTDKPTTPKPTTPKPTTPKPTTPKPTTPKPITPKPTNEPTTPKPITPKPTDKSTTPKPTTPKPTNEPTTPKPITPKPTDKPTTPKPTNEPTTPKPSTPKPTEHEEECPGFPGIFVNSLIHCPPPTPKPTDKPMPSTPIPTNISIPPPTNIPTPSPTEPNTPSPTDCPELPQPTEPPVVNPTPKATNCPNLPQPTTPPTPKPSSKCPDLST